MSDAIVQISKKDLKAMFKECVTHEICPQLFALNKGGCHV